MRGCLVFFWYLFSSWWNVGFLFLVGALCSAIGGNGELALVLLIAGLVCVVIHRIRLRIKKNRGRR